MTSSTYNSKSNVFNSLDEELQLAKEKMEAAAAMKHFEPLLHSAQPDLREDAKTEFRKWEKIYDSAIERFIIAYQPYAHRIINEYASQFPQVPFEDIVSAVYDSQKLAAEKFDPVHNTQLAPLIKVIANRSVLRIAKKNAKLNKSEVSLSDLIGPSFEESSYENIIPQSSYAIPDACLIEAEEINLLYKGLEQLSERERFILIERFGLNSGVKRSRNEIGNDPSLPCLVNQYSKALTGEAVRIAEGKALKKLKGIIQFLTQEKNKVGYSPSVVKIHSKKSEQDEELQLAHQKQHAERQMQYYQQIVLTDKKAEKICHYWQDRYGEFVTRLMKMNRSYSEKLVAYFAAKFYHIPLDEIEEEVCYRQIIASMRFDPSKGKRFKSFFYFCSIKGMFNLSKYYSNKNGRFTSFDQVVLDCNNELKLLSNPSITLDPQNEPDKQCDIEDRKKLVNSLLDTLSPKNREFICQCFELDGFQKITPLKLSKALNVSTSYIRAHRQRILKKLRKKVSLNLKNELIT